MNKINYPCSQSALYQVGRTITQSLFDQMTAFSNFKTKFNQAYGTTLLNDIKAGELLRDFQARSAQSEVDYIVLCEKLEECLRLWQNLKRYILATYPSSQQKPRLEEAGANFYDVAGRKNWDAAKSILQSASIFLTTHQLELEANQNMPASFTQTFNDAHNDFSAFRDTYLQGLKEIKIGTDEKIATNNALYARIIELCLDGQQIFTDNEALRNQFTFTSVLENVSGTGTTGFKGYVMNISTGSNMAGALITTMPATKTITSDVDGYYEFRQIPAGKYNINVSLPGFEPLIISNYQVDSGILHNLQLSLNPLPVFVP